jgi:hypothetical protein
VLSIQSPAIRASAKPGEAPAWVFLLLGTDSLIACIAVGPIISRRIALPFAILFGVGDGGGYLLGTAFHWSVSDSFSTFITTSVLTILGVYWIAIAIYSRWATAKDPDSTRARWAVWILPWALSVDNITYGLVSGVPAHASVWFSAGEQTLTWPAAPLTWPSILTSSAARTRPTNFAGPTRLTWPTPST